MGERNHRETPFNPPTPPPHTCIAFLLGVRRISIFSCGGVERCVLWEDELGTFWWPQALRLKTVLPGLCALRSPCLQEVSRTGLLWKGTTELYCSLVESIMGSVPYAYQRGSPPSFCMDSRGGFFPEQRVAVRLHLRTGEFGCSPAICTVAFTGCKHLKQNGKGPNSIKGMTEIHHLRCSSHLWQWW